MARVFWRANGAKGLLQTVAVLFSKAVPELTGWLEIHRAKLTARGDEIAFSLIYLKDRLGHRARNSKGNIPRSSG
jgi:hypothetical protein